MSRVLLGGRRSSLVAILLLLAVVIAGCDIGASGATPTPTPTTTPVTGGGGPDAPIDLDRAACDALAPLVREAFPVAALIEDVTAFEAGGGALLAQGCRVMVLGDSDEMPSFTEVDATLRGILEAEGWVEDPQYAADGPTASITVYRNADQLALVASSVAPKTAGDCPPGQIIGDCLDSLEPDAILVQGAVVVAVEAAID